MDDVTVTAFLGVGLVLSLLGAVSLAGRLPRNPFAGIRVGRVMQSDAAWRAGHRAAAPAFLATGLVSILAGAGLWGWNARYGVPDDGVIAWVTGLWVVQLLTFMLIAARRAVRAADATSSTPRM